MKKFFKTTLLFIIILFLSAFSITGCDSMSALINGETPDIDDVTGDIQDISKLSAETKAALREDFTEQEKYYIGRSVCAYVFSKYNLVEDKDMTEYLNKIGSTCATASNKSTTFNGYRFVAFKDDHPNAYGTPGGMILISTGMINLCENEDEIAAVLAHEVEHVVKDHPMKAISDANKKAALISIAKYVAQEGLEETALPPGILDGMVDAFGKVLDDIISALDNGYERETEYEADAGAVLTLHTAGYSADSLKSIIEKLPHNKNSNYGSNHPTPKERIDAIDKRIKELSISTNEIKQTRTDRFKNNLSVNVR